MGVFEAPFIHLFISFLHKYNRTSPCLKNMRIFNTNGCRLLTSAQNKPVFILPAHKNNAIIPQIHIYIRQSISFIYRSNMKWLIILDRVYTPNIKFTAWVFFKLVKLYVRKCDIYFWLFLGIILICECQGCWIYIKPIRFTKNEKWTEAFSKVFSLKILRTSLKCIWMHIIYIHI